MSRSRFDESRDQRIADEQTAPPRGFTAEQMCAANGCPNRWAVDAGSGKLCSAHAWADVNGWAWITQQQWDRTGEPLTATDRHSEPLTSAGKRAILARLSAFVQGMRGKCGNPKAWAWKFKAREEAGDKLNEYQRNAWRQALAAELRPSVDEVALP